MSLTWKSAKASGSTPDEALKQVELAKNAWFEAARAEGKSIPQPKYKCLGSELRF